MHSPQQALGKDQVEYEQQQDARCDEDLRGDDEADIHRVRGPGHAETKSYNAEETDVNQQDRKAERTFGNSVVTEDEDVYYEADDVEEHEDCADRHINGSCGFAAQDRGGG